METTKARTRRHRLAVGLTGLALLAAALVPGGASAAGSRARLDEQPPGATSFRVSSFNLLGAGHTAPGGERKGWATGAKRMKWAVRILDEHAIDVVGFQELQRPQFDKFDKLAGSRFGIFPGDSMTTASMANSIAWRNDVFRVVRTETIQIPYFKGNLIRMPYVLLQNRETGQQAWFFNSHNPANAHGPAQKWRNKAVAKEIDLVNRLRAEDPDVPVFVTGDMNDREKFFCPVTAGTELLAANGGSNSDGTCTPPVPTRVDWVMGTDDITFTGYTALRDALVAKTTDHFVIYADANVPPPAAQDSPVNRVLLLSVDGLRAKAVARASAAETPALHRLVAEGASTINARTEAERTTTLPNMVGMLTGRRVKAAARGHGVKYDADQGGTVAESAGKYVSSVFDLVHNLGGSTALVSSNPRAGLVARSWDGVNGGTDPYGTDDGRNKISTYLTAADDEGVVDRLVSALTTSPATFTFAQLSSLDAAGKADGFRSDSYDRTLGEVDALVGRVLRTIAGDDRLADHTLVVLTAGSGGKGHSNTAKKKAANYKVPLMVWGPEVARGADLYALNPAYTDPGRHWRGYAGPQPIRNAVVANLATAWLRLPPIPGSTINQAQDFNVSVTR